MRPEDDTRTDPAAAAKRAARERALAARDALAPAARARLSALVCARAAALAELERAETVMLFASFRSEVDTAPLIRACLERGKAVALPRVAGPRRLEAVEIRDPAADLVPGKWGIPEPRAGLPLADPAGLDLVFVPGAAFSPAGARCGYGGGFYDAFLPRLARGTPRVALAFEAQVLDEVPCEAHDLAVDAIVTETRVIRPGADGDARRRSSRPARPVDVGVLLAGGQGRRTGVDKRYLVLQGRTLLRRNLEFLGQLFPTVAVSVGAGQELDLGDAGPVELLPDAGPGASPLAGIATALARFDAPVFVLAADLAAPSPEAAARVLAAYPGHDAALPATGPHLEPLFAVYGPRCLAPMRALLGAGRHRIVDAFPGLDVTRVPFPDAAPFRNINDMDDFAAARRELPRDPEARPALVAVVGKSDAGKTTLIERLIPELAALGLRVGSVKHDAHGFEIDHPGKDSWRHGRAGAAAYAVASPSRLAFVTTLDAELPVEEIAARFFAGFDIVVAEGYKRSAPHKVEVFRSGAGHAEPLCAPGEAMALVTDAPLEHAHRFALDDAAGLARFLAARLDTLRRY